jgi:uncharacterized protein (DUF1697 family)
MTGSGERYVALLRGVNVGRAKKVAMADLRALIEGLGYADVRTILNSGNVVFGGSKSSPDAVAQQIESALEEQLRLKSRVTVITAKQLETIMQQNPLLDAGDNPSRLHVAFLRDKSARTRLQPLTEQDWGPDALAIGANAAYLWCPNGMTNSDLPLAVDKLLRDDVTVRTWGTVSKIAALVNN